MIGYGWLAKFITVAILAGFIGYFWWWWWPELRVSSPCRKMDWCPRYFQICIQNSACHSSNWFCFAYGSSSLVSYPSLVGDSNQFRNTVRVCTGVHWHMGNAQKNPDTPRPFKTPLVPLVPILGALICAALIIGLDFKTQLMAFGWLLVGLVVYFTYSKKNNVLRKRTITVEQLNLKRLRWTRRRFFCFIVVHQSIRKPSSVKLGSTSLEKVFERGLSRMTIRPWQSPENLRQLLGDLHPHCEPIHRNQSPNRLNGRDRTFAKSRLGHLQRHIKQLGRVFVERLYWCCEAPTIKWNAHDFALLEMVV